MKKYSTVLIAAFAILPTIEAQTTNYPFRDPNLGAEQRIDNLLSLMTTDEKVDCLGTRTAVPRLGVPNIGSSEGIHGVVERERRGNPRTYHHHAVSAASRHGRILGSRNGPAGCRS